MKLTSTEDSLEELEKSYKSYADKKILSKNNGPTIVREESSLDSDNKSELDTKRQ